MLNMRNVFHKILKQLYFNIPDVSRTYDKLYRHCHIYALEGRTVSQNFNQIETRYIFENVSQFFFFAENVSAMSDMEVTNCAKLRLRRTFRNV